MSRLGPTGLTQLLTNIKTWVTTKLGNYVTTDTTQTITGKKSFTNAAIQLDSLVSMSGSTMFIDTSAAAPRGAFPAEVHRVGRVYIGDNTSYNGAWFIVDPIIDTNKAYYRMVTTNPDNTDSARFTIAWDSTKEGVRRRRNVSQGDLLPSGASTYNLGESGNAWQDAYINKIHGISDFANITSVTLNANTTLTHAVHGRRIIAVTGTRTLTLPAPENGSWFLIKALDYTVTINPPAGTTIASYPDNAQSIIIKAGETVLLTYSGETEYCCVYTTGNSTALVGRTDSAPSEPKNWFRVASCVCKTTYSDPTISFKVYISHSGNTIGTLTAHCRVEGTVGVTNTASTFLQWQECGEGITLDNYALTTKDVSGTSVTIELWCKLEGGYSSAKFVRIIEHDITNNINKPVWLLTPNRQADGDLAELSDTDFTNIVYSTLTTLKNDTTGKAGAANKVQATIAAGATTALVQATVASNDCFRIAAGGAANAGWAEIATGDDANEPIYVRQYKGNFTTLQRTATLLDGSGNTSFPGTVTATGFSCPVLTTIPNDTIWPVTASTTDDITYLGANAIHVEQKSSGKLTDLSNGAWSVAELGVGCFFFRINSGTDIRYKHFGQNTVNRIPVVSGANRFINDVTPNENDTYSLGTSSLRWSSCYSNAYYLGTTAFGDIVTHNASEFLTSHQSLANYVTLNGAQTISGIKTISTHLRFSSANTRGTAPSANEERDLIDYKDSAGNRISLFETMYYTDKSSKTSIYAYKTTAATGGNIGSIGIGCDASGNVYTYAPTPASLDNSTKIATTAFVYNTAAKHLAAATNIYVAKVATGNGSGSNTSNYMSLTDLRTYLATVHMHSAASNMNGSYNLQILFKAGDSFGDATFDATKMPGVRNLILNTSTGTNSTVDNYSTNSPTFGNITVTGDISVTMRNLNCTGRISSQHGAYVNIDTYMGISSLQATNYGYLNVTKNMVINVCDAHADYLCLAMNNGILAMWPGATVTINFRQQCYYTRALFYASSNGTAWIGYSSFKLTGTEPMAVWGSSGTLTGTSETAAATVEKAVTLASGQTFTLTTNATAKVKFTVDNTANNPTLNIGGTGAKPIYWNNAPVQAAMLMKNITYDVKYNGSQFVIQNAVKRLTNNDFGVFRSNGNYNQTYNSGSWNFTGWTLYYGTGIENSNWRGSHIGNIQQNVSTSNNTYPVLISGTANATANASTAPYFAKGVKINPSTNSVYATDFYENGTALSSKYAQIDNISANGIGTTCLLAFFPAGTGDLSLITGQTKPGTSLCVVYWRLESETAVAWNDIYNDINATLVVNRGHTETGTWKLLHSMTQGVTSKAMIGVWVRIV